MIFMKEIFAPISLGELIDKITILEIKSDKFQNDQLTNIKKELSLLNEIYLNLNLEIDPKQIESLKIINQELWQIEDSIRDQESKMIFDNQFIELARLVYKKNDIRSAIKKGINLTYGSSIIEEKSYLSYNR